MNLYTSYQVKIKNYNEIFLDTLILYRKAVDWFISVILQEWNNIEQIKDSGKYLTHTIEHLTIKNKNNPELKYNFDEDFHKFPVYLRRSAITDALSLVSSYKSNLKHNPNAKKPKAGHIYPALYRDNMYVQVDDYTAEIKVWIRNTWDWLTVQLKKTDVDYILHHCSDRKECVPTLRQKGKQWFLVFSFYENIKLNDFPVQDRKILSVDLGVNNACTYCVMTSDGTILDRKFLKLSREQDCLNHAINKRKKAQQNGARHIPRLWAKINGINKNISVKTAEFIINIAKENSVNVIVMEALDTNGKKKGKNMKEKIHLWKTKDVQRIAQDKAHRLGMRFSHVNAWNTSRLAFDGSGKVKRGIDNNYSMCRFTTGKIYNCDLNASYNIGARYFIREITKSLSATTRLYIEAKVPQCFKRSTCTLATLINLNAELSSLVV